MKRPDLSNIWHAAYRRWYDHNRADHEIRAVAWGVVSDGLCVVFDRFRLWGVKR